MSSAPAPDKSSFSPVWLLGLLPLAAVVIAGVILLNTDDPAGEPMSRANRFPTPAPVTFIPPTPLPTQPPTDSLTQVSVLDQPLPDITLTSRQGETFRLSDMKGHIIFLNFWATWCEPCRDEMPALQQLQDEQAANGVQVVAVTDPTYGQTEEDIAAFIERYNLTLTIALSSDPAVYNTFGIVALPITFIIDWQGTVRYRHIGPLTAEDMATYLDWLAS
jgi:peroxiredoxin